MTPHDTYPSFVGQFTGVYELEGHERGAFATLSEARPGHRRIELRNGGERFKKRRIRACLAHKPR